MNDNEIPQVSPLGGILPEPPTETAPVDVAPAEAEPSGEQPATTGKHFTPGQEGLVGDPCPEPWDTDEDEETES